SRSCATARLKYASLSDSEEPAVLKLLRLLAPFRALIAAALGLALAQSIANLFLPRLMADIVDKGIARGDTRVILTTGSVMLAMVAPGCAVAGAFLAAKIAAGFGRIVRARIFERVSYLSLHQFDHFGTASLITRTTNDTTQVQQVLILLFSVVISAPMTAIGG